MSRGMPKRLMKRWAVDSNIFLRFFTNDEPAFRDRAERILRRAARGEIELVCGPPVLFEIAWTLCAAYKRTHKDILDVLRAIATCPGVTLADERIVHDALARAEQAGIGFADAYIAAMAAAHGCEGVATFNPADFIKLSAGILADDDV